MRLVYLVGSVVYHTAVDIHVWRVLAPKSYVHFPQYPSRTAVANITVAKAIDP